MMINLCEAKAKENGFNAVEPGATLPDEPMYTVMGYKSLKRVEVDMPDSESLTVMKMRKEL